MKKYLVLLAISLFSLAAFTPTAYFLQNNAQAVDARTIVEQGGGWSAASLDTIPQLIPTKRKWTQKEAVVFVNQSNGRGTITASGFPTQWQAASTWLKEYNFSGGALAAVQAGTNRSFFLPTRPSDTGLTGPITVAQQYWAYLNKNLYAVNMTRGGSGVYPYSSSYFNFSSGGFAGGRAALQAALSHSTSDHTFVISFAGENESELPNGDPGILGFEAAMRSQIADMTDAIQDVKGVNHRVSFILMGVHQYSGAPQAAAIQAQQQAIAATTPNCKYIDTDYLAQPSVHFVYADYVSLLKKITVAMRELRANLIG